MVKWKRHDESLTVYLSGEIDHCAAEMLREEIEALIRKTKTNALTLDFKDVVFMDSSGIGMLIGRYKTMMSCGGRISACQLRQPIERLYRMAGLHRIIPIMQDEGREMA